MWGNQKEKMEFHILKCNEVKEVVMGGGIEWSVLTDIVLGKENKLDEKYWT